MRLRNLGRLILFLKRTLHRIQGMVGTEDLEPQKKGSYFTPIVTDCVSQKIPLMYSVVYIFFIKLSHKLSVM